MGGDGVGEGGGEGEGANGRATRELGTRILAKLKDAYLGLVRVLAHTRRL